MLCVKTIAGAIDVYPYTPTDLIRANPHTSFPSGMLSAELLAEYGVFPVKVTEKPAIDSSTQRHVELFPVYEGDAWVQQWAVAQLTSDEINSGAAQQSVTE